MSQPCQPHQAACLCCRISPGKHRAVSVGPVADAVAIPPGIDQPDFHQPRQFVLNSAQRQAGPTRDFPKMQLATLHAEEQPENFSFPFGRYDINQRHHNVCNKHTVVCLLQSMGPFLSVDCVPSAAKRVKQASPIVVTAPEVCYIEPKEEGSHKETQVTLPDCR
jgi:hypothetical protein